MKLFDLINCSDPKETIIDFLRFACQELGLNSIPKLKLVSNIISNSNSNSFASYSPSDKKITLYTPNRHIMDILRSLCHELIHYKQDLLGELNDKSGLTGSEHENEANAVAGQILRKWGKIRPELFQN